MNYSALSQGESSAYPYKKIIELIYSWFKLSNFGIFNIINIAEGGIINMNEESKKEEKKRIEEFRLNGTEALNKIKELIHQANIRRIIIRDEDGKTFMEIPLSVSLVGAALLPVIAAVGALAALVARLTIVVEKIEE